MHRALTESRHVARDRRSMPTDQRPVRTTPYDRQSRVAAPQPALAQRLLTPCCQSFAWKPSGSSAVRQVEAPASSGVTGARFKARASSSVSSFTYVPFVPERPS